MVEASKNVQIIADTPHMPSEAEVCEYAEFLGIDPKSEPHLMWIAREGVVAPVPPPWKACAESEGEMFYFNFETGESVWDHPCDEKYRHLVEKHRGLAQRNVPPLSRPGQPGGEVSLGSVDDETRLDEVVLTADGDLSGSHESPSNCKKPARKGDNRLELITNEISDEESDGGGVAVDVLDLEVASKNNGGVQAVQTLCRLAQRHREAGAAADQKETLERALAIHEQSPGADKGLLLEILRGLAHAHGLLGEPEAERRVLGRIASLSGMAGGAHTASSGGASPERGLAGVGLAPAGLARVGEQADDPDSDDDRHGGLGFAGHTGSKSSSRARHRGDGLQRPAPLQLDSQLELSGQSGHSGGKNSSALSEISEDFAFDQSISPSASMPGLGGRATPLGDTLELSVSASMSLDASAEASAIESAARAAVRQSMTDFKAGLSASARAPARRGIEGEVKSLNRALAMLKEIREKQREYLGLLEAVL